jgi:hypothetical protein
MKELDQLLEMFRLADQVIVQKNLDDAQGAS